MKKLLVLWLLGQVSVARPAPKEPDLAGRLQSTVFATTMVMIHDVVNPPAASRFYTYCLLGAHEIVAQQHPGQVVSAQRFVQQMKPISVGIPTQYNYQIAALYCILETGRLILPSGYMLEEEQTKLLDALQKMGYSQAQIDASVGVAQQVAKQVMQRAAADNYSKLSTRVRYKPVKDDAHWYPTPPAYIEAIEPHWRTIKPMLLDSCSQFKPAVPAVFSKDSTSSFYRLAHEVYSVGKSLTTEQRFIASYWDCNPFAINTSGHMSIGFKKISPGGHWMNITNLVTSQLRLPFDQAVEVESLAAMTLMDAFISIWDEKYRSNRIRPETYINRYISPRWQPLLQTPPFPEYTSGHSVISTAVAEVLTYLLGDNIPFIDTTEVIFDLPERKFSSFRQAAAEAAISRLYGGIHYRDAIENGQKQGKAIGAFVIDRLRQAGVHPALVATQYKGLYKK